MFAKAGVNPGRYCPAANHSHWLSQHSHLTLASQSDRVESKDLPQPIRTRIVSSRPPLPTHSQQSTRHFCYSTLLIRVIDCCLKPEIYSINGRKRKGLIIPFCSRFKMGPLRPSVESTDSQAFLNPTDRSDHVEKQASYPGEDTSYTSQRELNGWS